MFQSFFSSSKGTSYSEHKREDHRDTDQGKIYVKIHIEFKA